MPKITVDIQFKHWWEDYLEDIGKTGSRLIGCGVKKEKVIEQIEKQVKEIIPDAIEVNMYHE